MNMNGGLIDEQIVFSGNQDYDFFLFYSEGGFQPTLEELLEGEVRADWEDESDDNEEMEIMGFEPSPSYGLPENHHPQTIKIELSLNISINGQAVLIQMASDGLDSVGGQNASINEGEEKRQTLHDKNEFGGAILRI